jgi:hypothetical protein
MFRGCDLTKSTQRINIVCLFLGKQKAIFFSLLRRFGFKIINRLIPYLNEAAAEKAINAFSWFRCVKTVSVKINSKAGISQCSDE